MQSLAELVPTIPGPARAVLRNTVWAFGKATSGLRPLPDFLVIGAQRSGTTALYEYLRRHPGITGPAWKEASFFDRHWVRGEAWYRGNFPVRRRGRRQVAGEASPSYLFHPLVPKRVHELVPEVRLVALLRNPIDRALSHFNHEVALGREPLSFEEALDAEEARTKGEVERMLEDPAYFSHAWWNHTYLARGRYAEQLERWFEIFPREQLLVVANEELAERTDEVYERIVAFIGAPPHRLREYPRIFVRDYDPIRPETRARLTEYFAEPNRRLYELLDRDFGWS